MSVVDMARSILHDCDQRVDNLARMGMQEMMAKYKGVGPAKAVCLAADPLIRSSRDVREIMQPLIGQLDYEEFWVMMLSRSNRVKFKRCISQGGTAATVVDVKLLLKRALDCLAEGIILVHNHPSGNPLPSGEDDRLTQKIKDGASFLGIRVMDHVIIAGDDFYSYADQGRL